MMAGLPAYTTVLPVLALCLVLNVVVCLPVSTKDLVAGEHEHQPSDLDTKAMQELLKKLWRYEAEGWKAKFEDTEAKNELLARKVQDLQRELKVCQDRGVTTGSDEDEGRIQGTWHEFVASDVGKVTSDDENVEDDLRELAVEKQDRNVTPRELYDTDFVILPTERRSVTDDHDGYIRITSPQDDDVSVRVTELRHAEEMTYRVPPRGVIEIPLNRMPRNSMIQLQSDQPIRVQVLAENSLAEGFSVIAVSRLGTEYRLSKDDDRFIIVAMSNDTGATVADSSGESLFSAVLQQGQVFESPAGSGTDFAGGRVEASGAVAVFAVRSTQCDSQGCSGRTLLPLEPEKVDRKAWNDCLISSSGCKKKRPRPG